MFTMIEPLIPAHLSEHAGPSMIPISVILKKVFGGEHGAQKLLSKLFTVRLTIAPIVHQVITPESLSKVPWEKAALELPVHTSLMALFLDIFQTNVENEVDIYATRPKNDPLRLKIETVEKSPAGKLAIDILGSTVYPVLLHSKADSNTKTQLAKHLIRTHDLLSSWLPAIGKSEGRTLVYHFWKETILGAFEENDSEPCIELVVPGSLGILDQKSGDALIGHLVTVSAQDDLDSKTQHTIHTLLELTKGLHTISIPSTEDLEPRLLPEMQKPLIELLNVSDENEHVPSHTELPSSPSLIRISELTKCTMARPSIIKE
jgi:hypothetical protein